MLYILVLYMLIMILYLNICDIIYSTKYNTVIYSVRDFLPKLAMA